MTALMYSPAGFRRAPLLRRRRGMGATASDFATIAAGLTPGSADYQFFSGCANNPTAPACQRDFAAQAAQPVLTATQEAAVRAAQAQGATPPTVQATAPITWIPAVSSVPAVVAQAATPAPASSSVSTPTVPLAQPVQPANAPSPVETSKPAPVGFFSATILGIPLWIWGAAGIGAYFVFGQQGERYGG